MDRDLAGISLQLSELQEQMRQLTERIPIAVEPASQPAMAQVKQLQTSPVLESSTVSPGTPAVASAFRGPTSPEFALELAASNLQTHLMPGHPTGLPHVASSDVGIMPTSEFLVERSPLARLLLNDPLHSISLSEARRLIRIYQDVSGAINPILKTDELLITCEATFRSIEMAKSTRSMETIVKVAEQIASSSTITLKLVLANGSILDSCGMGDQARALFESVRRLLASSFWALPNLQMIQNWILVIILHFNLDEELQASRVAAHAARLCLEMGINRASVIQNSFSDRDDIALASKLVCNAFMLDRRSSVGVGIPPVIPASDMDVRIGAQDEDAMYMESIVALSRISGDIYHLTMRLSDNTAKVPVVDIEYLDFQVLQWQLALPTSFKLSRQDWRTSAESQNLSSRHLFRKFVLVLRANQLRHLIYKPVLYTAERITAHERYVRTAIEVAQETIQLLSDVSVHNTDMLHKISPLFKYFLISAFSILMLVAANSRNIPDEHHSRSDGRANWAQEEFDMAISLFKLLGSRSGVMAKLWRSVQKLQSLVMQDKMPRVGSTDQSILQPENMPSEDASIEPRTQHEEVILPQTMDAQIDPTQFLEPNTQLAHELWSLFGGNMGFPTEDIYNSILDPFGFDYGLPPT